MAAPAPLQPGSPTSPLPLPVAPVNEDIYANPPTITQTFLSGMNSEISDPALRNSQ